MDNDRLTGGMMPDPDYDAFEANPSSILDFMQNNIIATGLLPNSQINSVPEYLVLQKSTISVKVAGHVVGSVYYLKGSDKTDTSTALKSYICNYEKNDTKFVMLGDAAKFCFTVTMNGCTFGIGAPTSYGAVIVSHCNRASDRNQAETQRAITRGGHKNGQVTMLEPSMYRAAPRMTCSTFGMRVGRAWKFYFQSYRPNGENWDCYGVPQIQTNTQAL